MRELHGRCLCGAIEYAVPDGLRYAGYCHCSECRKFSGSAFSAFGGVAASELRLVKGSDHLMRYEKSSETVLVFCKRCGSSLYAEKPKRGMAHVRLGTLDSAPALAPQFHSFVASKVPWFQISDGLPQYPGARPPAASG